MSYKKMAVMVALFLAISTPLAQAKNRPIIFTAIPESRMALVREMVREWALLDVYRTTKLSVETEIRYATFDLDDDGVEEIFLLDTSHDSCEGTIGCGFSIWKRYGSEWRVICKEAIEVPEAMRVSDKKDGRFHEIIFHGTPRAHNWKIISWPHREDGKDRCEDDSDEKG